MRGRFGRLVWGLVVTAVVLHAVLMAAARWHGHLRAQSQARTVSPARPAPDPPDFEASAFRSLPVVARAIPEDARVLLVTSVLTGIAYEYYFLPRRFRLLQLLPPEVLQLAREHRSPLLPDLEERYRILEDRGLLLTPERLMAALAASDYVVTFFPGVTLPDAVSLEPVLEHEATVLYRVAGRRGE